MNTFGLRLKSARLDQQLTLTELASRCGASQCYMSQLEHDRRRPSRHMAFVLAGRLGVSEAWLLTGEGEKYVTLQPAVRVPFPSPSPSRPVLAKTTWRYRALEWLATRAGYRLVVPTRKGTAALVPNWGLTVEEALKGMEAAGRLLQKIREGVAE